MGRFPEADLTRLRRMPAADRATKVSVADFAQPLDPAAAAALMAALPDQLAGRALREVVARIVAAHRAGRPVVVLAGGHVVKVGVTPAILSLVERGVVTHLAMNGAAAIHDIEIAMLGRTSEDVDAHLQTGAFGMVDETGAFMNRVALEAMRAGDGLGEAWGRALEHDGAPHRSVSLLAGASRAGIPATVHVAIGTDTIHYDPACDGAALGETSLRDFRILAGTLAAAQGAVVLNLGSAVLMPEVFLKALAVARNLGASLEGLTTVNLDQIQHYRPRVNVVERPTRATGAKGYSLTGHHEVMVPLLCAAVLAELG
ncbi:MAG: hypothetical protein RL721_782 [Candidatus Eisenbacteria bacterium]|jgi:hypothetical protein